MSEPQTKSYVAMQMLYMRYLIGGPAELSAADCVSLDDMVTAQEGSAMTLSMIRSLQEYLIDAMQDMKVDQACMLECPPVVLGPSNAKGLA